MDGIMVSAATGVMNSLLDKLTTLLGDEYKLQKCMKHDITFLKDELSSMNALLEKLAYDTEALDPQEKEWRNQVREMAYDIEDCIDKYMHQLQHEPEKPSGIMGFFLSFIEKVKKLGARHEIVEQIQDIKDRIIEAGHRRKRYKPDVGDNSGSTNVVPVDPRLPALYAEASDLVGIDVPRDKLIKLVNDGEGQLKVVSIVGFGGLGKTTLANQIYQKVREQFDCQAFVSVSQKPDTRKIFQSILSQINKPNGEEGLTKDEKWLINALRDFLKDKRYFIVIDDIWSTQAWKIIKCALIENTCGSSILVTTRNANVARSCCFPRQDLVYELSPLSAADSKSLFFRRIFGSEDICPPQLKEVSSEIIRKCGGLPLAIITVSSLLTTKSSEKEEWEKVLRSIGSGLEKNSDVEEMNKILSLSYNDLPLQLRTCLLYLGMLPEDYEIERHRIVSRWIAEGFVKADGGRNLWEEGECYFNELTNRSMIQPVNMRYGQAMACRVHDMILDLIISKAVEENFITFTGDQRHMLLSQNKIRRLSLDYRGQENERAMSSMVTTHVRSLGIFGYSVQMPPISDLHALRVLDIASNGKLENCYLRNIGNLIQLRYLRIEAFGITDLPEQIGELQHLETLDLRRTGIAELPASIIKLRRLKSLLANDAKLPDGIGNMQALEEISRLRVFEQSSVNSLQELGSLTKLRTLYLVWNIGDSHSDKKVYEDILASTLRKLCSSNLRCLVIVQDLFRSAHIPFDSVSLPPHLLRKLHISVSRLPGIPKWVSSLSNLTSLSIRVNQVTQEILQMLGDLPALLYLELFGRGVSSKERLTICNNRFSCLKTFDLSCLIMGLMFEAGATPKLEQLWIHIRASGVQSACGDLGLGIHHLSALKKLKVIIDCEGARVEEVEALEAAITNAASLLPKAHLDLKRFGEKEMVKTEACREEEAHKEEDTKQQEEISAESLEAQPSCASTSAASN